MERGSRGGRRRACMQVRRRRGRNHLNIARAVLSRTVASSEGTDVALRYEGESIFVKAGKESLLVVGTRNEIGVARLSNGRGMLPGTVVIIVVLLVMMDRKGRSVVGCGCCKVGGGGFAVRAILVVAADFIVIRQSSLFRNLACSRRGMVGVFITMRWPSCSLCSFPHTHTRYRYCHYDLVNQFL